MKMLFFSSERAEVEQVRAGLLEAGVPCELRENGMNDAPVPIVAAVELWIQNDQDSHRAVMLCVELGVGFAKRAATVVIGEDDEGEAGEERGW
jgi:hypothetical protein